MVEGFWDRDVPASEEDGSQDELPGHEHVDMDARGRKNPQQQNSAISFSADMKVTLPHPGE